MQTKDSGLEPRLRFDFGSVLDAKLSTYFTTQLGLNTESSGKWIGREGISSLAPLVPQLPERFHGIHRIRASQPVALDVAVAHFRTGATGLLKSCALCLGLLQEGDVRVGIVSMYVRNSQLAHTRSSLAIPVLRAKCPQLAGLDRLNRLFTSTPLYLTAF